MKLTWPKQGVVEHMEEYDVPHKDITLSIHHVGEGDHGECYDPRVVKVTHQIDRKTGKVAFDVYVDASISKVIN